MSQFTDFHVEDDSPGVRLLAAPIECSEDGFVARHTLSIHRQPSVNFGDLREEFEQRRPSARIIVGTLDPNESHPITAILEESSRRSRSGTFSGLPRIEHYVEHTLTNCLFVGHLKTDLDSIAGAIGASELYGGMPACASEINSETKFVLQLWGVTKPSPIEEMVTRYNEKPICLVDHQQLSQLNPSIPLDRIVGVIDHHALQNATIVTDKAIFMDIRPWGSMSTIIGHTFITQRKRPTKSTAGMLLCAILSDTLNLRGPTTTNYDKQMVSILAEIAGVQDIQDLAQKQFYAKSQELLHMTAIELVEQDLKRFNLKGANFDGPIGICTIEAVGVDEMLKARETEIVAALHLVKEKTKYGAIIMAVVNIVDLHTYLILCSPVEKSLASAAWADKSCTITGDTMDIGDEVSRKFNFVPRTTMAVKNGWKMP